jgi:hypothetical protein
MQVTVYVGPICRSNGGLPFNSMTMDGLVGLDFNIGKDYVELSLKSYCVKAASHIFGNHYSDTATEDHSTVRFWRVTVVFS